MTDSARPGAAPSIPDVKPFVPGEVERLRSQVAALEQLLDVHESTSLDQSGKLEQSLREKDELLERERATRDALEVAQVETRESEARYRTALERYQLVARATNDVVWDWDLVTSELLWNDAIHTTFRFPPEAIVHTIAFWYDHIHPDDRDRVVDGIHTVIDAGGDSWSDEYLFLLGDGQYATVLDRGHVARDEQGKAVRMLGAMLDLTLRKRVERELEEQVEASLALTEELEASNQHLQHALHDGEQAQDRAEAARAEAQTANKAKAQFLANMSHELRTPLNAIGGYAQLLTEGIRGPITELQRADLERIKRSQHTLLSLINDILNFAKIEAGKVNFAPRDVSLNELLGELESLVAPQLLQKRLRYEYNCCDPSYTAFVDPERLQQILLNLLSNAVKFTPDGGWIVVDCGATPNEMRVLVRDSGVGIPTDNLESVFEPFVQLERGQMASHSGTGLGLAISRDLARAMRGDLSAESTPDVGSTFILTLPRRGP